jgi:hypothetical protein
MTAALESMVWGGRVDTEERWYEVAAYLIARLGTFLGVEVVGEPITAGRRNAVTFGIHGDSVIGGELGVEWSGILELMMIEGAMQISASLFLFSRRLRLQVAGQNGSSLRLLYERSEEAHGRWVVLGWHEDLYGEFQDIEL